MRLEKFIWTNGCKQQPFIIITFYNSNYFVIAASLPDDWPSRGDVKFSGVTLKYGNSKEPVIQNFDLHIPAGQMVNYKNKDFVIIIHYSRVS